MKFISFLIVGSKDRDHDQLQDQNLVSSLTIKTTAPSLGKFDAADDDYDHDSGRCRTPTSSDQRIPLVPKCPPAPRKPKSLPLTPGKRNAATRRRLLLDLSGEVESLFPTPLVADLGESGRIKKARKVN
ncbi:cyclin-dependent protein kinase inhibitor SMR3-like [Diospyros lotus]|uniref:cyclin-dependent protein kinase inhibitor SMR3-like n=1 Tax=Diospyros lotus TaxID=55363 RepID=UPI00225C39F7|nr:cyclin-dependent protein kinase inhibitor SMR3-like [Diospyros lotus]